MLASCLLGLLKLRGRCTVDAAMVMPTLYVPHRQGLPKQGCMLCLLEASCL